MSDAERDMWPDRPGPTEKEAREARRASMTAHARLVEDLVDEYTEAARCDATMEFFMQLASELLDLREFKNQQRPSLAMNHAALEAKELIKELQVFLRAVENSTQ